MTLPENMATGDGFSLIFMNTKSGNVYFKVYHGLPFFLKCQLTRVPADGKVPHLPCRIRTQQLHCTPYVSHQSGGIMSSCLLLQCSRPERQLRRPSSRTCRTLRKSESSRPAGVRETNVVVI